MWKVCPECASHPCWEERLAEPLVIRPTSETIIYETYSKWIQSYRDLPLLINQWANVVRWEMRTRPFTHHRILWQEGHTVHATKEDAAAETLRALRMYEEFDRNVMALPVMTGRKSAKETWTGADYTLSEALAGMERLFKQEPLTFWDKLCQGLQYSIPR